jgi:hypothetical protein
MGRLDVCRLGSSVGERSIYQERAGRAGGCSTALLCPGAVTAVHSYLRRAPSRPRVLIRRQTALGPVTNTRLTPSSIS